MLAQALAMWPGQQKRHWSDPCHVVRPMPVEAALALGRWPGQRLCCQLRPLRSGQAGEEDGTHMATNHFGATTWVPDYNYNLQIYKNPLINLEVIINFSETSLGSIFAKTKLIGYAILNLKNVLKKLIYFF